MFSRSAVLAELMRVTLNFEDSTNQIWGLSPVEKYDLAVADYTFKATKLEMKFHGNLGLGMPSWQGYCQGVSAVSIKYKEPFREVHVINRDGYPILFHPYDVKALLAAAYFSFGRGEKDFVMFGTRCNIDIKEVKARGDGTGTGASGDIMMGGDPDHFRVQSKRCRDMNPATFVLLLQNRLRIAQESFIIDQKQDKKVSNHPIGQARVDILNGPYKINLLKYGYVAAPGTVKLVDVQIKVWLGSTTLNDDQAVNRLIGRGGVYSKIGYVPEEDANPLTYFATLELDKWSRIRGGEWGIRDAYGKLVRPTKAPDFAWLANKPDLVDKRRMKKVMGNLTTNALEEALRHNSEVECDSSRGDRCDYVRDNPNLRWSIIRAIYRKSVLSPKRYPKVPVLDLRKAGLVAVKKSHVWRYDDSTSRIRSYLHVSGFSTDSLTAGVNQRGQLIGYVWGTYKEKRRRRLRRPWKADYVRMFGWNSKKKLKVSNLGRYKNYLSQTYLGDYDIHGSRKYTKSNKYHFRFLSKPAMTQFSYVYLFFYRYKRKPGEDTFVYKNGRIVTETIGIFRLRVPRPSK